MYTELNDDFSNGKPVRPPWKGCGTGKGMFQKNGGCLLSHLRSTIGAAGLNFSVRNGKRWDPGAKPP